MVDAAGPEDVRAAAVSAPGLNQDISDSAQKQTLLQCQAVDAGGGATSPSKMVQSAASVPMWALLAGFAGVGASAPRLAGLA